MKIKSLRPVLSKATLSVKNFKKTEPQLFWVVSICLALSLSFTVMATIKLSVFKNNPTNNKATLNQTPTVDVNQPRITGAWEVKPDEPTTSATAKTSFVVKDFNSSKVIWLDKPQKISPLDIFISKTQVENVTDGVGIDETFSIYDITYFNQASFYLIGNLSDGSQLIKVLLPKETKSPYSNKGKYDNFYKIIKSPDNQVTVIYSEKDASVAEKNKYLSDQIFISYGSYPELDPSETFNINGINFSKSSCYESSDLNQLPENFKFFGSTDYGELYTKYSTSGINGVSGRLFILKLKDWSYCYYNPNYDFISDNQQASNLKWSDNSPISSQFTIGLNKQFAGCGTQQSEYYGPEIIKKDSNLLQNKVAVATYNGDTFYQIKDINSPIVNYLYETYNQVQQSLSLKDFAQTKNHFLYQDKLGDWVIFSNTDYATGAECGKPVIYLYPQKESQVKVQVDAKITKSEPTYPSQGWLVTAKPNGELTYQNQSYPYLFWEGLGNGFYPDYRDQGTLVSQKDLIPTIYKQLSQLGLNQKESVDFMEFWQPRLPKSPYVRLTWLNTQDMNRLAPLSVEPKPDTAIRIFLEFEALKKPVTLKPQKLTAPARNGFTLIEWGGLLIKPAN